MDNKATCTSFGDENIFKAPKGGMSVVGEGTLEGYLHRSRRRSFDVKKLEIIILGIKLQQYFGFKVQEV